MKTIKRLTVILSFLLLTACGASWQATTLNHDPIYDDGNYALVTDGVKVDTLNAFQFRNKLRTDFNFRYDFAQYALSQPRSFDWNNRILDNRYTSFGPYSYSHYWNRTQMWNDWVWGYTGWNSWGSPHRWSPFGYDRWGYNMHYGWNNHGWGYNSWMGNAHYGNGWSNGYGYNGWHQIYGRQQNTSYINGRRGSISNEVVSNRRVRTNTRTNVRTNVRTNTNTKPRVYVRPENTIIINNNKPRVVREKPKVPVIRNNNRPPVIRNNNRRPSYNNTRPSNNVRPRTNNNNNTRSTSTNVNRSTNSRGGSGVRKN